MFVFVAARQFFKSSRLSPFIIGLLNTLTCTDPVSGDVPDPAAACAHLRQEAEPFAPLAPDLVCTEQYGGPQTARVTGRWAGADVDLQLSRSNGCRISQWDRLGPLLPGPVG